MQTCKVSLFILDISGYTRFLVNTDLVHAEETITSILNALYTFCPADLILNKVEGDALFFYSNKSGKETLHQLSKNIFTQFSQVILKNESQKHSTCPFSLCQHLNDLSIKFFIHEGEIAFHRISDFQEMIGKAVIEIHRIMKNSVASDSYILTIDQNGKYSDKFKYIGKINYDLVYLDEKNNLLKNIKQFIYHS